MKILFSHKLMGIVVSSWRTSNISWHGVTRLNAIWVLISSLQHLWPRENGGVRWFSFFHSLALFPGCACLLICCIISLPAFSHSSFCVLCCFACVATFPGRIPPVCRGCMHHFCTLVCHLVSRQGQMCSHTSGSATCSSTHFCPGALRPRCTTCQPAVSSVW